MRETAFLVVGAGLSNPEQLLVRRWSDDDSTATEHGRVPPRGHPEYGYSAEVPGQRDGRAMVTGSETAYGSGGLSERAIESSGTAVRCLGSARLVHKKVPPGSAGCRSEIRNWRHASV